jgi:hypothetical protein
MKKKNLSQKIKDEIRVIKGESYKDRTYSSESIFPLKEDAEREFKRSVKKLFNVNRWSELPGITSEFILYSHDAKQKNAEKPDIHDYIKIILPGPVPENWVIVTDIKEDDQSAEFTVSPSINPEKGDEDRQIIEHFFTGKATSTFKVTLGHKTIHAYEIGRNEWINNAEEAGNRKLINTFIAEGGWAGVQKFQWEKLTDYLVHKIEIE